MLQLVDAGVLKDLLPSEEKTVSLCLKDGVNLLVIGVELFVGELC